MEWKSVGMMTFPIWWESHNPAMFQTTNQILWFSYGFPIVSMVCSSHPQPVIHFEPPFCLEKRTNCWITTRRFSEESWRWRQAIRLTARVRFARKHQRQTWNQTVSQDFFPVPVFVEDRGQHLKPKPEISDMLTFLNPTSWSMWFSFTRLNTRYVGQLEPLISPVVGMFPAPGKR